MNGIIKSYLMLFIMLQTCIYANNIDISLDNKTSILEKSAIYLDVDNLNITDILSKNLFEKYQNSMLNIGLEKKVVWLKFSLHNSTNKKIKKTLVLNSPILENIELYNHENIDSPTLKGTANLNKKHSTVFPNFPIILKANSTQTYYLKIESNYSPVSFALTVENFEQFYKDNMNQQLINSLLIGFILALMIYSLVLGFYTKNISYFFYSLYLTVLISQQISYLGLLQIYLPLYITTNDYYFALFKVAGLVITSSLFAIYFLKTELLNKIHKIYKLFIIVSLLEIFLHYTLEIINLEIVVLTSIVFIIYNLSAAVIIYRHGNKQARLFIVGFGIVFLSYAMMILDTLGVSEFMQVFPNAVTWATALEALVLSLAFADQYAILQEQKEKVDEQIFEELKSRELIVKNEVVKKTSELNEALKTKELLLQEINHRVKNNLQIILSIIRLQNDNIDDNTIKKKFTSLEYRINAIASSYNMLIVGEDLQKIDMSTYIESLLLDIKEGMFHLKNNIKITTDIQGLIPLKQSVYIGLIINELITNTYKYAFDDNSGEIKISLKQDLETFVLIIEDNGKGFKIDSQSSSLGLRLIKTLIEEQLQGDIQKLNNNTKNIIRFTI